jgi:hypothetical protein
MPIALDRIPGGGVAASDFVSTEWGFGVVRSVLVMVTVSGGSSGVRARRDAWVRELRRPDSN